MDAVVSELAHALKVAAAKLVTAGRNRADGGAEILTYADEVLAAKTNWSEALYTLDDVEVVEPDVSELEAEIERLKVALANGS